MLPSTAWRRRVSDTARRGSSPTRPAADSIERLSPGPEQYPTTPPATHHSHSSRMKKESNGHALQGLGLSHLPSTDADHLYLDADGRAHLGAKVRSPRHTTARAPTTHYRGPPKRTHARVASAMSIDDLANIAIATSPQFNSNSAFSFAGSPVFHATSRPNTSYINGYVQDSFDRPAKRIKSERLHQGDWSYQDERPRSSYAYQTEIRQEDAELLLSLHNGFSFKKHALLSPPNPRSLKPEPIAEEPQPSTPPHFEVHPKVAAEDQQQSTAADPEIPPEALSPPSQPEPAKPNISPALTRSTPTLSPSKLKPEKTVQDEDHTMDVTEAEPNEQEEPYVPSIQAATGTAEEQAAAESIPVLEASKKTRRIPIEITQPVCPTCNQINSNAREGESTIDWIKCEAPCNRWFHIPCAGFTDQEVKKVAKFICNDCEPNHGHTTFARTSSRARAAPDYAALNEGVTKSNQDSSMHHFVPKLKDGSIKYHRDDFARIRPDLMTQQMWENFDGMKRPFVVPARWNPRFGQPTPGAADDPDQSPDGIEAKSFTTFTSDGQLVQETQAAREATTGIIITQEDVVDVDQDYLHMIMPKNLTVRKVAELYGPDEEVPVIDVKSQNSSGKYTLRQWANYYEEKGIKPIRNVISLEVSHSRLGRLIRRPKVVQDIDLEDQVWDAEARTTSRKRPVTFYCLMSVADSYTDFHIDFGGSSVYYHILEGRKTFFFIPPEDRYLRKYEQWNDRPDQNAIWLGDWCDNNVTRVDLYPGDTAFIPAGWIHSVWTPEDSLVIGGNFLTRYDLDMQLKVNHIEKVNKTAQKFRYPMFQKIMWYTLLKYLEDDPVPESIIRDFQDDPDYAYVRALPVWRDGTAGSPDIEPEECDFNHRIYPKSELKGLPALRDFLYRTAKIASDLPVEDITKRQIDAVKASIPKGHGDPLQLICEFAVWVAWKRGNEKAPEWLHSDLCMHQDADKKEKEKIKKLDAFRAYLPGERSSTRRKHQSSNSPAPEHEATPEVAGSENAVRDKSSEPEVHTPRIACAACRKKRSGTTPCQHSSSRMEETAQQTLEKTRSYSNVTIDIAKLARVSPVVSSIEGATAPPQQAPPVARPASIASITSNIDENTFESSHQNTDIAQAALARLSSQPPESNGIIMNGVIATPGSAKKGRSKACEECRKSKRRCVHDEHGRVDPAKAAEPSKPRGSTSAKRPPRLSDEHQTKRLKTEDDFAVYGSNHELDTMIDPALMASVNPVLGSQYPDPSQLIMNVNAIGTPQHPTSTHQSLAQTTAPPVQHHADTNLDPALMDPALLQSAINEPVSVSQEAQKRQPMLLPSLSPASVNTPDVDKSFSPITAEEAASKHGSEEEQLNTVSAQVKVDEPATHVCEDAFVDGATHSLQQGITSSANSSDAEHQSGSQPSGSLDGVFQAGSLPEREPVNLSNTGRRSSSRKRTSQLVGAEAQQSPLQTQINDDDTVVVKEQWSPSATIKRETTSISANAPYNTNTAASTSMTDFQRADTAGSNEADADPDIRLARELQAQEHGLRRRPSVRIS